VKPIRKTVETVLANPQELWEKPYRNHISDEGRALMLALYFNADRTPVTAAERSFMRIVGAMGLPFPKADLPAKFRSAVKEIEGSVLAIQDRQFRFANPGVRDFLQRAIAEDRFLPTIISAIAEFEEVTQAWRLFMTLHEHKRTPGHATTGAWLGAAQRLVEDNSGTELERLSLLINMYDQLDDERFLPLVHAAIRALEATGIDGTDAGKCTEVLEQVVLTLLPITVQDDARQVLSLVTTKMLTDYGGALTVGEIRSVATSLFECGCDQTAAGDATRAALRGYIGEISIELDELGSLSDLEDYEKELRAVMHDYGLHDERVARRVESRREELREERERETGSYSGGSAAASGYISTDQIRSMFDGLRNA
jgi:hypothetical protein